MNIPIEEYEQNTLCSLRKREPTSDGASDKSESSVAAANGEPSASDRQNPIAKVAKAAEQIIDLRELTRVEDSLADICADLGLITPDKEKSKFIANIHQYSDFEVFYILLC